MDPVERIDGDGITLRRLKREDAPSIAKYANDREVWRNLRDRFPHPYTEESALWFVSEFAQQEDVFAVDLEGEAIGACGMHLVGEDATYRCTREIGYWLGRAFWGRGLATRATALLCDYAWRRHPEVVRLQAEVFGWNAPSCRVLEKNGFSLEGRMRQAITKDGQTIDALMYSKLRGE